MKLAKNMLFCLVFLGLAACRPASNSPIPLTTPETMGTKLAPLAL